MVEILPIISISVFHRSADIADISGYFIDIGRYLPKYIVSVEIGRALWVCHGGWKFCCRDWLQFDGEAGGSVAVGVMGGCTVHGSLAYAGKVKRINIGHILLKHLDMEREARHQCILHKLHCIKQHRYTMVCEHIHNGMRAHTRKSLCSHESCKVVIAYLFGVSSCNELRSFDKHEKRVPWLATLQVIGISGYCGTVNLLMYSKGKSFRRRHLDVVEQQVIIVYKSRRKLNDKRYFQVLDWAGQFIFLLVFAAVCVYLVALH
ncbi:hypothetical protein C5167_018322 [Papaver somniferum]|uniref:Uncharacterized protein n=1 Tax=Papaver somniferum TaxID=3469 RepID=A0A4Y7IMI8_PAPSO|nr:hypothetical protein C5167_018322 [Papaver somniferum]